MKQQAEIASYFKTKRKILLTTHVRPDGDAIGSVLALYHFFHLQGHQVNMLFPSDYPNYYSWFPGIEQVQVWKNDDVKLKEMISAIEVLIAVDFNQLSRNGDLGKYLSGLNVVKVLMDHHPEPESIFQFQVWDTSYCAAAEAVFELIDYMDASFLKNKDISTCIYAALISDSGSFSFSSVSASTFRIAARLVETGINHELIQRQIFNNFTEKRLRFWAHVVAEKMTVVPEAKLVYILIHKEDLKCFDVKPADTENLVNFPMMLKDILVSVLIMEREDYIKLSFRSKNKVPVNFVARDFFNGGGHTNAAGGESKGSLEETIALIIEQFSKIVPEIEQNQS